MKAFKTVKSLFIGGAVALLILTMSFSYFLNISGLRKNYDESINSKYSVLGDNAILIIEYSIQYGKSLERYFGIEDVLGELLDKDPLIESAAIFDLEGNILSDVNRTAEASSNLAPSQRAGLFEEGQTKELLRIDSAPQQHLLLVVKSGEGKAVGGLELVLNDGALYQSLEQFTKQNQLTTLGVTLAGCLILLLILVRSSRAGLFESGKDSRKKLLWILMGVMLVTQSLYTLSNVNQLRAVYKDIGLSNAQSVSRVVGESVERLFDEGLGWQELQGIDQWLAQIAAMVPDIEQIRLTDTAQKIQYQSSGLTLAEDQDYLITQTLSSPKEAMGSIQVLASKAYINQKLFDLLLDSASIIITSILLYIELSFLMIFFLNKSLAAAAKAGVSDLDDTSVLMRNLAFFLIFGTDLSLSFIPIISRDMALQDTQLLSSAIAMALPIQAELLGTSIMALITGIYIDKKGWKPSFLQGIAFLAAGSLLSGLSANLWFFIAARAVVGVGYGLSWTSMTGCIGRLPTESARIRGYADLVAGIYAGSNCGVVVGAMLLERVHYGFIFALAVVMVGLSGLIGFKFVRNEVYEPASLEMAGSAKLARNSYITFFKDPAVIKFLLCISLPGMAMMMFLNYFVPLYSSELAISQSNLGRLFLIYGLCMIYLGPLLIDRLSRRLSAKQMLVLGGIAVGVSLLIFSQSIHGLTLVFVIFLISVADSFAISSKTAYFTNLEASVRLGIGKATGILGTARKLGMIIGTNIFGLVLLYPVGPALWIVGSIYLAIVVAFVILTRDKSKKGWSGKRHDE